ncbi:hypothetical protein C7M84_020091 [Penaeus vannamei]|uniref:C2H2-type domain-containing protein n=1 Tax=Penaeus vannamei TaxID=6689 RepID=A0A423SCV0_PENVA|nr:hypothetical protein C7M84_020091 [Penaeus vannamei]
MVATASAAVDPTPSCSVIYGNHPSSQSALAAHLMAHHKKELAGGWCVLCGQWSHSLLSHVFGHSFLKVNTSHFPCHFCHDALVGQDFLSWVVHSWTTHVFPCPFPTCIMNHGEGQDDKMKGRTVLATADLLLSHIKTNHLPGDGALSLDEVSVILQWIRGGQGGLLMSQDALKLDSSWHSHTDASLQQHRTTCHGLRSWDALWTRLKHKQQQKSSQLGQMSEVDGSVMLVGIGQHGGIIAKCDPSMSISSLMETSPILSQETSTTPTTDHGSPATTKKELNTVTEDAKALKNQKLKCNAENPEMPDTTKKETEENASRVIAPPVTSFEDEACKGDEINDDSEEDSGSEPPLQIDTAAASPSSPRESYPHSPTSNISSPPSYHIAPNVETATKPSEVNADSVSTSKAEVSSVAKPKVVATKTAKDKKANKDGSTPTFELVDALNSVVAHTIRTMTEAITEQLQQTNDVSKSKTPVEQATPKPDPGSQAIQEIENIPKKKGNIKEKVGRRGEPKPPPKGLGENADIDEASVAENILQDLNDKFNGQCVGCGVSVLLPRLSDHVKEAHPQAQVNCTCGGFQGALNEFLVHSFHLSHLPSEARPIVLATPDGVQKTMVVLEARTSPPSMGYTYPCFKCGKRFKQEKSRQLHYNLCKLEKKFECDVCGEKFVRDHHLVKHKEWKHNPQTCPHCGKCFTSEVSLTQHVLHIHKKQLTHKCEHCGDRFSTRSRLRVHVRIHTGERPHSCQRCPKSFVSRNLLAKHLASDHQTANYQSDSSEDLSKYKSRKHRSSVDRPPVPKNASDSESETSDCEGNEDKDSRVNKQDDDDKAAEEEFQTRLVMLAMTESDLETSDSESDVAPASQKRSADPLPEQEAQLESHQLDIQRSHTEQRRKNLVDSSSGVVGAIGGAVEENQTSPVVREEMAQIMDRAVGVRCGPCHQTWSDSAGKLLHMYLVHPHGQCFPMEHFGVYVGWCSVKMVPTISISTMLTKLSVPSMLVVR